MLKREEPDRIENYDVQDLLGRGGSSQVYLASCRRGRLRGRKVAIKIVPASALPTPTHVSHHVKSTLLHSKLHHPSIISLLSSFHTSSEYYHVLELCAAGPLSRYLMSRATRRLTESEARGVLRQLIDGLLYLGRQRVIHRDIKADNILLTEDMRLKLADFGLATQLTPPVFEASTFCGTPNYLSPEVIARRPYDESADVWALGCFMISILTGKPPFQGPTVEATLDRASNASYVLPDLLSSEASDLIKNLLEVKPEERLPLSKVPNHPFFHVSLPAASLSPSLASICFPLPDAPKWSEPASHAAEGFPSSRKSPLVHASHHTLKVESILSGYNRRRNYSDNGDRLPLDRPVLGSIGNTLLTEALPKRNGSSKLVLTHPDGTQVLQKAKDLNMMECTLPTSTNINQASNSYTGASHAVPTMTRPVKYMSSLEPIGNSATPTSSRGETLTSTQFISDQSKHGPSPNGRLDPIPVFPEPRGHSFKEPIRSRSRAKRSHDRQPPSTTCVSHDCSEQADCPTQSGHLNEMGSRRFASQERGSLQVPEANTGVSEGKEAPLLPIDITSLPAKVYDTPHGTISIIDQPRELIVDLRTSERAAGRPGNEVLRISEDGVTIKVCELMGLAKIGSSSRYVQWRLDNLPKTYLKWYRFANRFVDMLKSRTPKFIFFTPRAKCTVMSNRPLPDVELTFPVSNSNPAVAKMVPSDHDPSPTMRIRLLRRSGHVEVYRSVRYLSQPTLTTNVFGEGEWTKRVAAIPKDGPLSDIPLFSRFTEEREGLAHMDECLTLCAQLQSLSFDYKTTPKSNDQCPSRQSEELWKSLAESTACPGPTTLRASAWKEFHSISLKDHNTDEPSGQRPPKSALFQEVRRRLSSSSPLSAPSLASVQARRYPDSSDPSDSRPKLRALQQKDKAKRREKRRTPQQLLTPTSSYPNSKQPSPESPTLGPRRASRSSPETRFIPALGWCLKYSAENGRTNYKVMFLDGVSLEVDQDMSFARLSDRSGRASERISLTNNVTQKLQPRLTIFHEFLRLYD